MTEPTPPERDRICVTDGKLAEAVELREFLGQLALVMRLPPKKSAQTAPKGPGEPAGGRRRTSRAVLAGAALVLAGAIGLAWPDGTRTDPLPPGAEGRWVTKDPRYADRGFELRAGEVSFETGSGPQGALHHPVRGMDVRRDRGHAIITIEYMVDAEPMTLAFSLDSGAVPTIRFKHQPEIVWTKVVQGE